jgi:hypothetical protein
MDSSCARRGGSARIFLVGGAALLLEVLLTRIAAITLSANLASGVIALSIGAPAPRRVEPQGVATESRKTLSR